MERSNLELAMQYAGWIIEKGDGKAPMDIALGTKVLELVEELVKYFPGENKTMFYECIKFIYLWM